MHTRRVHLAEWIKISVKSKVEIVATSQAVCRHPHITTRLIVIRCVGFEQSDNLTYQILQTVWAFGLLQDHWLPLWKATLTVISTVLSRDNHLHSLHSQICLLAVPVPVPPPRWFVNWNQVKCKASSAAPAVAVSHFTVSLRLFILRFEILKKDLDLNQTL